MLIGMAGISEVKVADYADLRDLAEHLGAAGHTAQAYASLEPGRGEYPNFGLTEDAA
ncbi:hypothetical protein [Caulobacter sp. 17J65-9]|uniref:hypothetical protein n=1 Tax=Caulobacter sp. 17J65-9 TaxID=2709382 RepID=UPI0013C67A9E|nr:hypothetical protein [Caulobacter sp. 17J65-9]NEX95319.1 hypothetical protein [Caulobacter sp. 17J65-9]